MPWKIKNPLLFVAPWPLQQWERQPSKSSSREKISSLVFLHLLDCPQPAPFTQLLPICHSERAGKPPGVFYLQPGWLWDRRDAFASSQITQKAKIRVKEVRLICLSTNALKSWIHSCPNVRKLPPKKPALCGSSLVHKRWIFLQWNTSCNASKYLCPLCIRVWGIATPFIIKRGLFF